MKKIKRRIAKIKASITLSRVHSALQTALLCWLVYRVEGIHHLLHNVSELFQNITQTLSLEIIGAKLQFEAAIDSILSLFGDTGA